MNILGIPASVVSGKAYYDGGGSPHSWNEVRCDGVLYCIDCCWDDPTLVDYTGNRVYDPNYLTYEYFMLSPEQMAVSHHKTS